MWKFAYLLILNSVIAFIFQFLAPAGFSSAVCFLSVSGSSHCALI